MYILSIYFDLLASMWFYSTQPRLLHKLSVPIYDAQCPYPCISKLAITKTHFPILLPILRQGVLLSLISQSPILYPLSLILPLFPSSTGIFTE